MRFVFFYHSFASCWNHGNVHFLRGIARELIRRGHEVHVFEQENGWSRVNALADGGAAILDEGARIVPGVELHAYRLDGLDLDAALECADVVLAHEWNDPELIARLGQRRASGGRFLLLFHDTHHRAVTAPHELDRFELDAYDAILAFGEVLREVYLRRGWGRRAVAWHEAADAPLFRPMPTADKETDLVFIGNWGDGERDRELQHFLVEPAAAAGLGTRLHGVRYPEETRARLRAQGMLCPGWLPNHRVPGAYAAARFTMHVPRRPYVEALPGIPTIRIFEALACGIPLVSAPWDDAESLFPDGSYLKVTNGEEAAAAFRLLVRDGDLADDLSRRGPEAIAARHTCSHRADELMGVIDGLRATAAPAPAPREDTRQMIAP